MIVEYNLNQIRTMSLVREMNVFQIKSIRAFVNEHRMSDHKQLPCLNVREEFLMSDIYSELNDVSYEESKNPYLIGHVASKMTCDSYNIVKFDDKIYFVEANNDVITNYYVLDNNWHTALKRKYEQYIKNTPV
jgi:hypothetical protein